MEWFESVSFDLQLRTCLIFRWNLLSGVRKNLTGIILIVSQGFLFRLKPRLLFNLIGGRFNLESLNVCLVLTLSTISNKPDKQTVPSAACFSPLLAHLETGHLQTSSVNWLLLFRMLICAFYHLLPLAIFFNCPTCLSDFIQLSTTKNCKINFKKLIQLLLIDLD